MKCCTYSYAPLTITIPFSEFIVLFKLVEKSIVFSYRGSISSLGKDNGAFICLCE